MIANADVQWTKGGNMCAGVVNPCTTREQCTATAIGPCFGARTVPFRFLKTTFRGLAYVDADKYLSCDDVENCDDIKIVDMTGVGYRDVAKDKTGSAADSKYSYVMTGNVFGNMSSAGGYAGISTALNTGSVAIKTNTFPVYAATADSTDRAQRDESDIGAPDGPYDVCISEANNGECNGAEREFPVGAYKFSIYGYAAGSNYSNEVVAGINGYPAGMDHLGVRVKVQAVGFSLDSLLVNGAPYSDDNVNVQVESIGLGSRDGVGYSFPQKYNIGSVVNAVENDALPVTGASKNIQIRVTKPSATDDYFYVDYLFETASIDADTYFIYDPTITAGAGPVDSSASSVGPLGWAAALLGGAAALLW